MYLNKTHAYTNLKSELEEKDGDVIHDVKVDATTYAILKDNTDNDASEESGDQDNDQIEHENEDEDLEGHED